MFINGKMDKFWHVDRIQFYSAVKSEPARGSTPLIYRNTMYA